MPLTTLIVDDEPLARKVLREELGSFEDVEVIGEADNGVTALEKISAGRPDLVLLDLQMPEMNGLEVARNIRSGTHMPVIVIVTAYDKYALEAFEAGAVDYLLKPVSGERLADAIKRAKRLSEKEILERLAHLQEIIVQPATAQSKRIVGRIGEEYFLLSADEIYAFQADGEVVWIITAKKRYLASQTLKVLDERLSKTSFRRIHRNALVNIEYVRKMSALSSQRWLITLANDHQFIASKRQATSIRQLLNG
ncbi:MAG: response regulator transcription factor [Bryobacterales bacterium]|nr:response regulator transcription factor [Bryobacterales bacterium]